MKNSTQKDDALKSLFAAHKTDIPDSGFSQRVMETLPDRSYSSPLRYVLIAVCAFVALAVMFWLDDGTFVAAIADLIVSVSTLSVPSPQSFAVYIGLIAALGGVGFAAYKEA